jgi:hypothetical protein
MDSGAQGRFSSAQNLSHLVVGKLLRVPEQDSLSHPVGKTPKSVSDAALPLLDQKLIDVLRRGRLRAVDGPLPYVVLHDALAPKVVAAPISRGRDEPDDELPLGPIVRTLRPDCRPGLLGKFAAGLGIVQEAGASLHEPLSVALDQYGESLAHPCLREGHKLVVAPLGQGAGRRTHEVWGRHHDLQNTAPASALNQSERDPATATPGAWECG